MLCKAQNIKELGSNDNYSTYIQQGFTEAQCMLSAVPCTGQRSEEMVCCYGSLSSGDRADGRVSAVTLLKFNFRLN